MLLQAVLSGLSFAIGYGLGAGWIALWRYLGLPALGGRMARAAGIMAAVICVSMVAVSLWHTVHWQNSLREIMGMEKIPGLQPFLFVPVAVATFFLFLVLARVFRWLAVRASRGLARHGPPRVSAVVAVAVTTLLFWFAINGLLFGFLLRIGGLGFHARKRGPDPDVPQPPEHHHGACGPDGRTATHLFPARPPGDRGHPAAARLQTGMGRRI
jgi:uncharacterized membrane protein